MNKEINFWVVLISLGSSIITAIVAYFLNSSKTKAETAKIKAETDKIIAETKIISDKIESALQFNTTEIVYYDSSINTPSQFDFEITKQKTFDNKTQKEIGEKASGEFTITNNILNIERTDGYGRFGVILKAYKKGKDTFDCIKLDPEIGQQRKIYITCEAKSLKSKKHTLDFVLRNIDSFEWIANKKFIVQSYEWTKLEAFFKATPDKSFRFKIYDRDVEDAPNSIQIRNLKVMEKY